MRLLFASLATAALVTVAPASVTVYSNDLSGFVGAAGTSSIALDFDSIGSGTNIGSQTYNGATFAATGGDLIVVKASDTFSTPGGFPGFDDLSGFTLPSTSGENVLSPGGAELVPGPDIRENDGLQIAFASGTRYFGFDHLSQSRDGFSFTAIDVFDDQDQVLYSGGVPIGSNSPWSGGSDFWGIVSDTNIAKVIVYEYDQNNGNPDSNIGYDSLRYEAVPEPATLALVGLGLAAVAKRRRR